MITNREMLTRPVWSGVKDDIVCPYCGGDQLEVEEELERAGEVAQCLDCLKYTLYTENNVRKLNK